MALRKLISDSAVYGMGDLLFKAIGFFTFPLIASYLSPAEYGTLEMVGTITGFLALLINCGVNNSVQRYYWDSETDEFERNNIVTSGLFIQVFFALILVTFSTTLFFFYPSILSEFNVSIPFFPVMCAILTAAFMQIVDFSQDIIRLYFKPKLFLFVSFLNKALVLSISVFVIVIFKKGVEDVLVFQTASYFILLPLVLFLIRKDLNLKFDKKWASKIFNFGYPFIFTSLAFYFFSAMDRWMIAKYSTIEEVGIYSVSFRFTTLIVFVSSAFGQAWSPYAIKIKTEHPEKYKEFYSNILSLLFFLMLVLGGGLSLFSGEIIGKLMSPVYFPAALPLAVLTFGIIFQATTQITAVGISLEKKTFLFTRVAWISCGTNFVLNFLLIPKYGALGSCWATLIAYMVLTFGYLFYSQKLHPLPINWMLLAKMAILGFAVLIISIITNSTVLRLDLFLIKTFVAGICVLLVWKDLPLNEIKNA